MAPTAVKAVFNDDSFQLQSTLTIENLIYLFRNKGKSIILGDKETFKKFVDFSDEQSREITNKIIHLQNIQWADEAWTQKDYSNFIKFIDKANRELLPTSYLKKYKIALDKSNS